MVTARSYNVRGMTCAACATSLEKHLGKLDGVKSINVSYPNHSIDVEFSEEISEDDLAKAASSIGYELVLDKADEEVGTRSSSHLVKLIFAVLFTLPIFIISMFFMGQLPNQNWILLILSLPVLFYSGSVFFVSAYKKIQHGQTNMDTLVALGAGTAFLFSLFVTLNPSLFANYPLHSHIWFESAAVIITFVLLGKHLEEIAIIKTRNAIAGLIELQPNKSSVVRNGEELIIPTTEIRVGDLVIVRAGDRFPVDGKVKRGEAMVDEQLLTGESQLILKTKGSRVKTGTTNTDGLLKIVATSVGKDTVLARIIDHIKRAQGTKPLIQKRVDRISSIFVPVVVAIAALTFLVWGFATHPNDWVSALMSMVTVLIVACPCALGLATPTALMVGVGKASKQGILIRDATVLETLSSVSDLIVDKTGTLTEGKPLVKDVKVFEEDKLIALSVLAGLMKSSKHPLSEAIVNHLHGQNSSAEVSDISTLAGKGVTGFIEGQLCSAGSERFMIEQGVELDTQRYMGNDSCVYWAKGKQLLGYITLHDEVKQGVAETIHWLKKHDIKIHLLSGDRTNVVQQLADDLGLSIWKAQCSPSDKADYTQKLQESGSVVAMVGDGINDAVALTQAQIGISMSTGAEIAIDASEIALLHGDFSLVKSAMQISEDTLRTVNQNLFWAFIYNIIAIPIAAGVLYPINDFVINPMIASFAMSFSSVSVLLNSLRLNLKRIR